jgi:hypothetical protein
MDKPLEEILKEAINEYRGIILRYIPKTRVSLLHARHYRNLPNQRMIFSERFQQNMVEETRENSYGGKWLAMWCSDAGESTIWSRKHLAMGDTPEMAIQRLQRGAFFSK